MKASSAYQPEACEWVCVCVWDSDKEAFQPQLQTCPGYSRGHSPGSWVSIPNVLLKYACTYSPHRHAGVCKRRFVVSAWKGASWSYTSYFSLTFFFDLAADSHSQLQSVITQGIYFLWSLHKRFDTRIVYSSCWDFGSCPYISYIAKIKELQREMNHEMKKMWMNVKISIWLFFLSCSATDGFFLKNNILSTSWLSTKQSNRKVCQRSFVISRTITPISWHLNCFQRGSPWLMAAQQIDNRPINLVLIAQQVRTTGYDFLFHSVSFQLSAVHPTLSGLTPHLPVTHKCPQLPFLGSKCTLVGG